MIISEQKEYVLVWLCMVKSQDHVYGGLGWHFILGRCARAPRSGTMTSGAKRPTQAKKHDWLSLLPRSVNQIVLSGFYF
jgi:hypothetical protein